MTATAEQSPAQDAPAIPPGGKSAEQVRDLIDKLRGRVDATGKLLGALGTTAGGAVGLSRIDDVAPVPQGDHWWAVLAVGGLAAATLAVLWVAARLSNVSRPIFMQADLDELVEQGEIGRRERKRVRPLYDATARQNGFASLRSYDYHVDSLRRIARQTVDPGERARRTQLANEARDEIELTLLRGTLIVVRRRAAKAITGFRSWVAYFVVVGGLLGFALGTGTITRDRPANAIAVAKGCGDARTAGATASELKAPCQAAPAAAKPDATAAQTRGQIATDLVALLRTCETAVASKLLPASACDPLRVAIRGTVAAAR